MLTASCRHVEPGWSRDLPTHYILYGEPVKSSTDPTLRDVSDEEARRSIGTTARAARTALRLTQAEVANAIGMAPEVYGRIERGLLMPSVPTLISIALQLRVSPDALLGWAEVQSRVRPEAFERILALLESADETKLRRALAVLQAMLAKEPPE